MKHVRTVIAALLLAAMPFQAMAQTEKVLGKLRAHGFVSLMAALDELQSPANVPAADAPLAVREAYYRMLLELAHQGRRADLIQSTRIELQKMADSERCTHCRFDLLLSRARGDAGKERSAEDAAELLQQAEALLPEVAASQARYQLLDARALLARRSGKINQAIAFATQAGDLARRDGNAAAQLNMLNELIGLNSDLGDAKRAVTVGNEAYQMAQEIGYRSLLGPISLELGHAYSLLDDRVRQLQALERALSHVRNDPDLLDIEVIALNNLSDYWLSQPDGYGKALAYAKQAETRARTTGLPRALIAPLANIGIATAGLGRVDEGLATLRQSLELAKQDKTGVYTLAITQELVRILKQAGRYQEALAALESSTALQAERTRQEREIAVLELQEKYSAERKNDEIEKLAAQNSLKQSELEVKKWQQRLWVALAIILTIGSLVLLQVVRRIRRSNSKLANANASLSLQSATDPLTGAFNRRHTQTLLGNLRNDPSSRTGLVLLDLDFFKRINDTLGHAAGDAVLVELVHRLRSRLRQNDVVARWGGEEFVLVLPNTPPEGMPTLMDNVLKIIGSTPFGFEGRTIPATVSLGAISFPAVPGQSWEAALGLADAALYLAKASGRNQAVYVQRIDVKPDCGEADLAQMQAEGRAQLLTRTGPAQQRQPGPASGAGTH